MHELEQAWGGLDARLSQQDVLLRRIDTYRAMDNVRSRLRGVTIGQVVQLAVGLLVVFWAGGYWWDRLGGPTHLVVYGLGLHVYGLALLITAAVQLGRVAMIDYRKPVMEVQWQLLGLRKVRVTSERILLMLGFIAWVPLVFIVMHKAGMDLWVTRPSVVLWNLGAGVAMAGIVALLIKRFPKTFADDAVGRSLRDAEADLAELSDPPRES